MPLRPKLNIGLRPGPGQGLDQASGQRAPRARALPRGHARWSRPRDDRAPCLMQARGIWLHMAPVPRGGAGRPPRRDDMPAASCGCFVNSFQMIVDN